MLALKRPEPRVGVLEIEPYVPGSNAEPQGATVFKLSSNETPLGPSLNAVCAYHETAKHLGVYPDGSAAALRAVIGRAYALDPALIVCGAGSDELLNLLAHPFLGPGDEAIHTVHGFLVFRTATLSAGGRPVMGPECNYTADVDTILSAVIPRTKIVFLANPNNPTGTYLPFDEIKRLRRHLAPEVLLVLDAAYAEYVRCDDYNTPVSAVLKHAKVDFLVRRPKGVEGEVVTAWLWPEQAFAILQHAETIDAEFSILLAFLLYTGVRLSEALRLQCDDVRIEENFAYVGRTKNGDPRAVHLPAALVEILAKHPRKLDRKLARVFRFAKGGNLYWLLRSTCMRACGLEPPKRVKRGKRPPSPSYELDWVNFHTFCHSWATWMRRYGKLDTRGLVGTGRWKSEKSAERYNHVVVTEESRRAELLPRPMRVGPEIRAKSVRNDPSSA